MSIAHLYQRADRACQRRLARWLGRRPLVIRPDRAIVSFTFDDFPRSALVNGGRILERHGAGGTYYASLGLAGRITATGEIFDLDDLPPLLELGHELGCHTYSHCPAWDTAPAAYAASIAQNADALRQQVPGAVFDTHSYPISHPRPETKRIASRHFATCRAGGQTFNIGSVDLNHLSALFIEQSRDDLDAIRRVIDANARQNGWLIFATHDVTEEPTRFGCTPRLFEQIVQYSIDSGACLLPVSPALARIRTGPATAPSAAAHR